jgi:hypothetical protein
VRVAPWSAALAGELLVAVAWSGVVVVIVEVSSR